MPFVKSSAITFTRVSALNEAIKNIMEDINYVLEAEKLADEKSPHANFLEDIYGELSQVEIHVSRLRKRLSQIATNPA